MLGIGIKALLLLSLLVGASSLPAAFITQNSQELRLGETAFQVVLDATTGTWKELVVDGKPVLATPRVKIPFDFGVDGSGRLYSAQGTAYRVVSTRQIDSNSAVVIIRSGDIEVECLFQLFPQQRRLRHSYTLTNRGKETLAVHNFQVPLPRGKFTQESHYSCPVLYPRVWRRSLKDFNYGQIVTNWRDPNATIIQLNPELTVMTMVDRTRPYSDISRTMITELPTGVGLNHFVAAAGYLRPGKPWQIGDFYCQVLFGDSDLALRSIHQWMSDISMTVPKDRNPKSKFARIYSFHPGQPNHPMEEWGGFVPSTAQLPRIRTLNCNTVWILPVESECPYIPDDFYRMANGIGTAEEYGQLVRTAQKLGMQVWQDVVPHGGRKTCQRAQEHPEWLLRDIQGNIPRVRSFDYNHPEWQKYMGDVVSFYTNRYKLDGWRIDTASFSHQMNWSHGIPYQRASWAMGQGGLGMTRVIRKSARKENPQAITLSECDGSIYGTVTDIVYDFPLCRLVFKSIRDLHPQEFVGELTAWLDEQQHAELQDLIRLRYVDSHDEPRAELLYGPTALRAAVALISWIDGVPMLYKEIEDGHSRVFSRIWEIREQLPVLSTGVADYRSCTVTPGVFACLRRDAAQAAIPIINFNPQPVVARVKLPLQALPEGVRQANNATDQWFNRTIPLTRHDGHMEAQVQLPPYGFTVLTPSIPAAVAPMVPDAIPNQSLAVTAFRLTPDGTRIPLPLQADGRYSFPATVENCLVFKIDATGETLRWRATGAGSQVGDIFRTRHPFYNSRLNGMHSLPVNHNVLWSSLRMPLGVAEEESEVLFYTAKGSARFVFPPQARPAGVFILDRIGDDHAPHLVIAGDITDMPMKSLGKDFSFTLTHGENPESKRLEATANGAHLAGEPRLTAMVSGWLFDNGKLRLRISHNGTLVEGWQRQEKEWRSFARNLHFALTGGYGANTYWSNYEIEAFQRLERLPDGRILLQFLGRPRGNRHSHILRHNTLNYLITYVLDDSAGFGYTCSIRQNTPATEKRIAINVEGTVAPTVPVSLIIGNRDGYVRKSERIVYHWQDGLTPAGGFGAWRHCALSFGANAPKPWGDLPAGVAATVANGVLDGSFELPYHGAFQDMVQMYSHGVPWQMPYGCRVATDNASHGKQSMAISFTGKDDQRLRQRLINNPARPGERWRLVATVSASKLQGSRADLRLHTPGKEWENRRQYVSATIPNGDYHLRKLEVVVTIPEKCDKWEIWVGGKADAGTLWVDDVRWEKVP